MRSRIDLNIKIAIEKKRARIRRLIIILFFLFVLVYLVQAFFKQCFLKMQTDVVSRIDFEDTFETKGFAIRKESLIDSENCENINYTLKDGEVVSKGGIVAYVFGSQKDIELQNKIKILEAKKEVLNRFESKKSFSGKNLEKLGNKIYRSLVEISSECNGGCALHDFNQKIDELQYELIERRLIEGENINLNEKLKQIDSRINDLKSQYDSLAVEIKSPFSGNFVSSQDGYEGILDYDKVSKISIEDLDNIESRRQKIDQQNKDEKSIIGKVYTKSDWFIAFRVKQSKAALFSSTTDVDVKLLCSSNFIIPAKVIAINKSEEEAVVVLRCNYMNSEVAKWRKGNLQICIDEYSGLKVDKNAIHIKKMSKEISDDQGNTRTKSEDVLGVYVLKGNELEFRQVKILHSTDDYVICEENPKGNDLYTKKTVEVSDTVVIGGLKLSAIKEAK